MNWNEYLFDPFEFEELISKNYYKYFVIFYINSKDLFINNNNHIMMNRIRIIILWWIKEYHTIMNYNNQIRIQWRMNLWNEYLFILYYYYSKNSFYDESFDDFIYVFL